MGVVVVVMRHCASLSQADWAVHRIAKGGAAPIAAGAAIPPEYWGNEEV